MHIHHFMFVFCLFQLSFLFRLSSFLGVIWAVVILSPSAGSPVLSGSWQLPGALSPEARGFTRLRLSTLRAKVGGGLIPVLASQRLGDPAPPLKNDRIWWALRQHPSGVWLPPALGSGLETLKGAQCQGEDSHRLGRPLSPGFLPQAACGRPESSGGVPGAARALRIVFRGIDRL